MSRRDTIIIAVLINVGLLGVLFMMAVHTDTSTPEITSDEIVFVEQKPLAPRNVPTPIEKSSSSTDEFDEVLKHYNPPPVTPVAELKKPVEKKNTGMEFVEVTVKKGDYLEKIARANGTSVEAIMQANHLQNAKIAVGQTLQVPIGKKTEMQHTASNIPQVPSHDPEYYTLKSGDNPWKIAKEFRVKFDDLLKMNQLDEDKARNLKPGDVLRVR